MMSMSSKLLRLKAADCFGVATDGSTDINNNPHFAVVATYCSNGKVYKELCCMKLMYSTTKKI